VQYNISKVLPRKFRRVLFYLERPSTLQFGVYIYGVGVTISNLGKFSGLYFYYWAFNVKSDETTKGEHGTKILNNICTGDFYI
jgi:hypothetical protein